jgi:hypothetical protein
MDGVDYLDYHGFSWVVLLRLLGNSALAFSVSLIQKSKVGENRLCLSNSEQIIGREAQTRFLLNST